MPLWSHDPGLYTFIHLFIQHMCYVYNICNQGILLKSNEEFIISIWSYIWITGVYLPAKVVVHLHFLSPRNYIQGYIIAASMKIYRFIKQKNWNAASYLGISPLWLLTSKI